MNNLRKVGLSALAGSLVATSANVSRDECDRNC